MLTLVRNISRIIAPALAMLLLGCGTTSAPTASLAPRPKPKPGSPRHVPRVTETLTIPGIPRSGALPSRYTCDGPDISPPLHWTKIPAGTTELIITLVDYNFIHGQPTIRWALAGLNPNQPGLPPGKLPPNTSQGTNTTGHTHYTLCPPHHTTHQYVLSLFTLPHKLNPKPHFNSTTLREQAFHLATTEGLLILKYTRH